VLNKRIFLILIFCVLASFVGCDKLNSNINIYNTDTYGTYKTIRYLESAEKPIGIYSLTLHKNNTYEYYVSESYKEHEDPIEKTYKGDILSVEKINKDIVKIKLDSDKAFMGSLIYINNAELYKYKNLIGKFTNVDIQRNEDFFIPDNAQSISGSYFSTDGTMISKNEFGTSSDKFRYKIHSNIIWVEFDANHGYQPQYYIVDEGVFQSVLVKQE